MMIKSVCAVLAMMSVLVPAAANANPAVTLFKVVTVKDEIVIGLTASGARRSAAPMPGPSRRRSPGRASSPSGNMRCARRRTATCSRRPCTGSGSSPTPRCGWSPTRRRCRSWRLDGERRPVTANNRRNKSRECAGSAKDG